MRQTAKMYVLFFCVMMVYVVFNGKLAAQGSNYELSPFGAHPADPYFEANNLGVKWNRGVYFIWSLIDPAMTGDLGRFSWKFDLPGRFVDFDYMVFGEYNSGLLGLHNIIVDGEYARSRYRKPGSWLPVNIEAYKTFVKATVKKYPFVRAWQVENEPDLKDISDPASFAELQRITYEAVKEANPNARVFIAGLAKNPGLGVFSPRSFYEDVLPLLKGKYIDGFDIHFYCAANGATVIPSPDLPEVHYNDFKKVYQYYRNLLDKNGYSNVPIWIAEGGSFSGTATVGPVVLKQTEAEQARQLVKMWIYPLSLGVEKLFWAYGLVEGFEGWDNDFFDHTGIIYGGQEILHPPGEKKLAYFTLKLLTEKLEGSDWKKINTINTGEGVYFFKLIRGGRPIWVAWNDNSIERQIVVTGIMTSKIKVTDMVPRYESGRIAATAAAGDIFKITTQNVNNGTVTVWLNNNPVIIEEQL